MRAAVLLLASLVAMGRVHGEEFPLHWSFDHLEQGLFPADQPDAALAVLRQAASIQGIAGQAVRLSRLDALRSEDLADMVSDGVFSIQFWLKVEWASRRHHHGDVLNFALADSARPWAWRIGFPSTQAQVMPLPPWPLVLRLSSGFSTEELPILIGPWQWTHVGFVGDGEQVQVYRNGGLIGAVRYPQEGLPPGQAVRGALQVNGSHNFSLPPGQGRTGVWECDLRLDELYLGDDPVVPEVAFPDSLRPSAHSAPLRARLAALRASPPADLFAVESLLSLAESIDQGADTRAWRQELLYRVGLALGALEQGERPLARQRGHLRLAYWSALDQSAQPYEVYVPRSWDGRKPTALVLALHGSTEDETVYFERYSIEEQAEKYGWIVATPYGRGQRAYRDAGDRDVLDIIDQVKRQWPVDEKRVYVTGHSMGGMGCVSLVREHPGLFAAAAPVAGWAQPEWMAQLKATPFLWVMGEKDGEWATGTVKNLMAAAREAGAPHQSLILEGYDHGGFLDLNWPTVVEVSLPEVFAFFDRHRLGE